MRLVAVPQPTIAVIPISRAMIAAWQVRPPWLVITPLALRRIGSQSGSVRSVTSRSPASKRLMAAALASTRATPLLTEAPMARPSTITSAWWGSSCQRRSRLLERRDCTVSGRACTMNNLPLRPSLAHSMSMAVGTPCRAL